MNPRTVEFLVQNTRSVSSFPSHDQNPSSTGLPPLENFIANLLARSRSPFETMISAVIYLRRLQRLDDYSDLPNTPHAVFAGALILAAKVIDDSSLRNITWSVCSYHRDSRGHRIPRTGFTCQELNRIERQLLSCLRWDVHFGVRELKHSFKALVRYAGYTQQELVRYVRPAVLMICLPDHKRRDLSAQGTNRSRWSRESGVSVEPDFAQSHPT